MAAQRFDLVNDINDSERMREDIVNWWRRAHEKNHPFWLSGTPPRAVWERLEIEHLLFPGSSVLEVGIGVGLNARAMTERGCIVSALDVSPAAFEKVASFAKCYLAQRLEELPTLTFDLAISHLVAQHMTDEDLIAQISAVVASLKPHGVFAIQFAAYADGLDHPHNEMLACVKSGGVYRSRNKMTNMALAANARPVKIIDKESFPEHESRWHVIHLMRP